MIARVIPITLAEAKLFVGTPKRRGHHRHSPAPKMARFAIGVQAGGELLAVAIVGNPKAAGLQNGLTFEVVRVASKAPVEVNACSRLYSAAARSCLAMGFRRGVTYAVEFGRCSRCEAKAKGFCIGAACRAPEHDNKADLLDAMGNPQTWDDHAVKKNRRGK